MSGRFGGYGQAVAYVDEGFVGEVAEYLSDAPPATLVDPSRTRVVECAIDPVGHPPSVVVHYLHRGQEGVFRFALDDSVWSFGDAQEAAELVWVELKESLNAAD